MSNPPVSSAQARERILAAAREVFARRGFRSGSLNEIATSAGLTRAGVLHHFPSKAAVLLALLDERDRELPEASDAEPRSVFDLLAELEPTVSEILADRQLVQLAHILTAEASGGDHPAREWVAARYRRLRAHLAAAVAYSIEIGELSAELDPELVAAMLLGVIEGAENQWLIDPDAVAPESVIETMLWILRAAAGR